jgi:dTDP-4-dehydrorhamnose 3,5-epimerase
MDVLLNTSQTLIPGLLVAKKTQHADSRGVFSRVFCNNELRPIIGIRKIVQINHSITKAVGTIRGMHFQHPPYAEMKLVSCFKGKVWDVAVDLRSNSPTFLKWHAEILTPENNLMLVIPEGFAHGFQVIEPNSELLYLHTCEYSSNSEGGLRHDDPMLNITWPINVTDFSDRDANFPLIEPNFQGLNV